MSHQRGNQIMEAQLRVVLIRTERTAEGMTFYRMYDVALSRDRSSALSRSWTVMHPISSGSPLHGQTPGSLREAEVELVVTLAGVDDTSLQPVHARHQYDGDEIVWGAVTLPSPSFSLRAGLLPASLSFWFSCDSVRSRPGSCRT